MKFSEQNLVIAINCGSDSDQRDNFGLLYQKDQYYSTGGVSSSFGCQHKQYWLTPDVNIYCSERYGDNEDLVYKIPVKKMGKYVVNLKFSQVVFFNTKQKVFDIGIGQTKVLKDLDIFEAVGSYQPLDLFIELQILPKNQVLVYSITDQKTHNFQTPLHVVNGYDKASKKLILRFMIGQADNPKVNGIVITKGSLDESTIQNYVTMMAQIMKQRQAILSRKQKRQELDSGEYKLQEPFDGARESRYEMDHMKSLFNKLLQIPYLFEGLMFLFLVAFFFLINKMPDNQKK